MSYGSYTYITELIPIFQILYLYYGTYTCLTELILALYSYFFYFGYGSTRRYYRTLNLYKSTCRYYTTDTEVPIGTTELILILVFLILFLYYGAYTCISYLILVLHSIYLSYGSCTCITELILVQKYTYVLLDLYLYYRTYTYLSDTEVLVGTTDILLVQRYP